MRADAKAAKQSRDREKALKKKQHAAPLLKPQDARSSPHASQQPFPQYVRSKTNRTDPIDDIIAKDDVRGLSPIDQNSLLDSGRASPSHTKTHGQSCTLHIQETPRAHDRLYESQTQYRASYSALKPHLRGTQTDTKSLARTLSQAHQDLENVVGFNDSPGDNSSRLLQNLEGADTSGVEFFHAYYSDLDSLEDASHAGVVIGDPTSYRPTGLIHGRSEWTTNDRISVWLNGLQSSHSSGTSEERGSERTASSGTTLSKKGKATSTNNKRSPDEFSDADEANDSNHGSQRGAQRRRMGPGGPPDQLACPFAKHDPMNHRNCWGRGFMQISYLKYTLKVCYSVNVLTRGAGLTCEQNITIQSAAHIVSRCSLERPDRQTRTDISLLETALGRHLQ